ncbi:hypothetical protein GCM10007382_21760 [Salinibacterium xinjiangense]|uniref:Uncharacterized protein n=1 Tax=Salinibacterium xinjiangense TaxID=386302 RepID=A0A2C8ZWX7_9MICO|nr:hypothetical protein [Salinibacterium xinjiangense]GGL01497.1 hypothetical protein GCM10007382_21760 [Salinibacterium xinjiangense]SOE70530.1 hypothetical protein SAMN06296378_2252 [Salinibacterium xinjiangense]
MLQQWWNDIVRWFNSDGGQTVITSAIIPFIAIVVGGVVAGLIARGAIKRLIAQQDREHKAAAVATLIAAGRRAATWSTLSAPEKDHVEHQSSEAEVRVRLLPVLGATLAADWAAHQLATMKKNSTNYSFQAEQDLADFQDGLLNWQSKPGRAKKLFAQDLAAWKYETPVTPTADEQLATKQREWSASQPAASGSSSGSTSGSTPGSTSNSTSAATAVLPQAAGK